MNITEIYESLKGRSRAVAGELTIPGYSDEHYEELYYTLLELLADHIGGNYEHWYTLWSRRFHRQKSFSRHTTDFYDPQYEKPLEQQSIREQLCTLKFFVTRRTYSQYGAK